MTQSTVANLRRARDLADRSYRQPLDVAALAEAAGLSKYYFVRLFTRTYGETPMRYVTRRRIERAQDLLRAANLTVTEIGLAVGYRSLGSFTSKFTELTGASPQRYRNQVANGPSGRIPGCFLFMRGIDSLQESNLGEAPDR